MIFLLDFKSLADLMQKSKVVGGTVENRRMKAKIFYQDHINPMIIQKFGREGSVEFKTLFSEMLVLQRSNVDVLLKLDPVKKWNANKKNCTFFFFISFSSSLRILFDVCRNEKKNYRATQI
jgi:hypothetical protein